MDAQDVRYEGYLPSPHLFFQTPRALKISSLSVGYRPQPRSVPAYQEQSKSALTNHPPNGSLKISSSSLQAEPWIWESNPESTKIASRHVLTIQLSPSSNILPRGNYVETKESTYHQKTVYFHVGAKLRPSPLSISSQV
jgi:hypothetical protein